MDEFITDLFNYSGTQGSVLLWVTQSLLIFRYGSLITWSLSEVMEVDKIIGSWVVLTLREREQVHYNQLQSSSWNNSWRRDGSGSSLSFTHTGLPCPSLTKGKPYIDGGDGYWWSILSTCYVCLLLRGYSYINHTNSVFVLLV